MPKLDGILETAIHTLDMWRSRAFYESVPRLQCRCSHACCLR